MSHLFEHLPYYYCIVIGSEILYCRYHNHSYRNTLDLAWRPRLTLGVAAQPLTTAPPSVIRSLLRCSLTAAYHLLESALGLLIAHTVHILVRGP